MHEGSVAPADVAVEGRSMDVFASHWMADLPVTVVTAELAPLAPFRPTPEMAITLRGALGKAVIAVACVQPTPECGGCPHATSCPVPQWYEPGRLGGQDVRPFALRVLHQGIGTIASWTFMGAIPRPTLLVEALIRSARGGLGPDRIAHSVRRLQVAGDGAPAITVVDDEVVSRGWPSPAPLSRWARLPGGPIVGAEMVFRSRAQLVRDQHAAGPPDGAAVLDAAIRRVRAVGRAIGVEPRRRWPDPAGIPHRWHGRRWEQRERWSQRQGFEIDLGGFVGTLAFGPEIAEYADLLAAMEMLQIGRNTSAGMGSVDIKWNLEKRSMTQ